jgi:hypothetical protein
VTIALMVLTAPLAFPISKVLDWVLGDQPRTFDRKKLKALIQQQMGDQHDDQVAHMVIKAIDLGELVSLMIPKYINMIRIVLGLTQILISYRHTVGNILCRSRSAGILLCARKVKEN